MGIALTLMLQSAMAFRSRSLSRLSIQSPCGDPSQQFSRYCHPSLLLAGAAVSLLSSVFMFVFRQSSIAHVFFSRPQLLRWQSIACRNSSVTKTMMTMTTRKTAGKRCPHTNDLIWKPDYASDYVQISCHSKSKWPWFWPFKVNQYLTFGIARWLTVKCNSTIAFFIYYFLIC